MVGEFLPECPEKTRGPDRSPSEIVKVKSEEEGFLN